MARTSGGRMGTLNIIPVAKVVIRQRKSRKPFLEGMASALDLFGIFAQRDTTHRGERADFEALKADYFALAGDFWITVEQFEQNTPELPKERRKFDLESSKQEA